MTQEHAQVETPIGTFRASADDGVVYRAAFVEDVGERRDGCGVHDALAAYFAGDLHALEQIAVGAHGTAFQNAVWAALREIPVGTTASYGEIAERIGAPRAARAVGFANAANPIGLIVPCHRVVRTGGALGGYGFGVDRKRWLLAHEAPARGLLEQPADRPAAGRGSVRPERPGTSQVGAPTLVAFQRS